MQKSWFCYIEMPEKSLKYNYKEKSMKVPFLIYADMELSLEKLIHVTAIQ